MRIGTGVLAWCMFVGISSAAIAETLALDHLSFVHFEGASKDFQVPGGSIELTLKQVSPDEWSVRVDPSGLSIPEITYPSGKRAKWSMSSGAAGSLKRGPSGFDLEIDVVASIKVAGSKGLTTFPLHFTSKSTSSTRGKVEASRQGVPLDPASGYVQLVASAVNGDFAPTAPGKPFYVVLSGQITGLSAKVR
ncbi:MAG: hypothetical protein GY937_25700 [bacterium]|nr:hypothetical protein [bacterium]